MCALSASAAEAERLLGLDGWPRQLKRTSATSDSAAISGDNMAYKRTALTTTEVLVVIVLLGAAIGIGYFIFGQGKPGPTTRQPAANSPTAVANSDASSSVDEARRKAEAEALAAKQAEEARRQEADRLAQAERNRTSSVHGAAWVVRRNGDSIILRGLHIHLVRSTFADSSPVCDLAAASLPDLEDARKDASDSLAIERNHPITSDDPNDISVELYKSELHTIESQVKSFSDRIEAVNDCVQKRPPNMNAADAYHLLLQASLLDKVQFPYTSISVADADADVDGKYTIANVPPGEYYLFANFDSGLIVVDWLLPIHFAPGTQASLDLTNDNAIHIHNQTP
jgi:hypothetical protein